MAVEYMKGTSADREEIIDFANYVFSHSKDRVDFPSLAPKLYGDKADTCSCHHIVKENGKIKGMVGLFQSAMSVCGETLKVAGIGTVCVHPYSRGTGYMKILMANALEEMKKGNYDLAALDGQRQRYQYFGFEQCGQAITFNVSAASARHALKNLGENAKLLPLDESFLEPAFALHDRQQVKMLRDKDGFLPILRSWKAVPYAFLVHGEFAGYASVQTEKHLMTELVLSDTTLLPELLAAYFNQFAPTALKIRISPYRYEIVRQLSSICESVDIGNACGLLVLNFERVLLAALKLKNSFIPLPQGNTVVEILDRGTYQIRVSEGQCTVVKTEEKPEVTLSYLEAMNCFFSPLSAYAPDNRLPDFLRGLLPLPLCIDKCDMV